MFCELNPDWLVTVNHDERGWVTVRSCDVRVIATQDDDDIRDPEYCVIDKKQERILKGPAPEPDWDPREKFLQKNFTRIVKYDAWTTGGTVDVGFDSIRDEDWVKTGGISQNVKYYTDGSILDNSTLYGQPEGVHYEVSSVGSSTDDEHEHSVLEYHRGQRYGGLETLQSSLTRLHYAQVGAACQVAMAQQFLQERDRQEKKIAADKVDGASGGVSSGEQLLDISPIQESDDPVVKLFKRNTMLVEELAGKLLGDDAPTTAGNHNVGGEAPVEVDRADEVDQFADAEMDQENIERSIETDNSMGSDRISLAASNNLSMDSVHRFVPQLSSASYLTIFSCFQ